MLGTSIRVARVCGFLFWQPVCPLRPPARTRDFGADGILGSQTLRDIKRGIESTNPAATALVERSRYTANADSYGAVQHLDRRGVRN